MSREEIQAVYAQGEEAVIELIEGLLQQLATQQRALRTLEARVEGLENRQCRAVWSDPEGVDGVLA